MSNTLLDFPCRGLGTQKERLVLVAIKAAQEMADLDAATTAFYNHGACFWSNKPKAEFDKAMVNFGPFRNALVPYVNPNILDSPERIKKQEYIFREAARKYARFLENAYRVDPTKQVCGTQPNRCLEDAWALTQRLKARMFHSRMVQVYAASDRSGELANLLKRQYRLSYVRESLRAGLNPSLVLEGANPATANADAAQVDREIAQRFPDYARFYQGLTPSLDQLRSTLRDNEVYISYLFLDVRGVIAFRVTKREPTQFVRLDMDPGGLKHLISEINQGILEGGSVASMDALLREAGSQLLDPLKIPPSARVIIEADEDMSGMPFTLLRTQSGLLGATHDLAYVPSAGVFRRLRENDRLNAGGPYLGFGRSEFPSLDPLPQVEREIGVASQVFESSAAALPKAHESDIYGHAATVARARVLHLATHTVVADGEVGLLFHEGKGEDGLLTETEIVTRLPTAADLVVLSACDTARLNESGDIPGEAFSSLARAFFAVGAKKLLVTQWKVRDQFAAPFVERFMRSYAAHGDAPRALTEAQAAVRAMPDAIERDWAPWILVGD